MRAIDFAPLSRATIGFERLFDWLDETAEHSAAENYPAYNIEKAGEDSYRIVLAVAGFAENDLSVSVEANLLTVAGQRQAEEAGGRYLYRGIAARSFRRQFHLADHIQVRDARLDNGLLTIELVRELPEAMKPRHIEIGKRGRPSLVGGQQAA